MASTSLCSSTLPFRPFSDCSKPKLRPRKRACTIRIFATSETHDQNFYHGGRLVDESMIVLRKRIHEMKMVERNYQPPSDWMEWEKHYFTSYDSMICDFVGYLQTLLMNTRPSLALGLIAWIALSVPVSTAVVFFQLMEMTKTGLGAIHLN